MHENHHINNLEKDFNEIFTGFCEKEKHNIEYQYFCKTHNELCCAACLCKIKGQGNGQHKDCDAVLINDIKEEKKNKKRKYKKFGKYIKYTSKMH